MAQPFEHVETVDTRLAHSLPPSSTLLLLVYSRAKWPKIRHGRVVTFIAVNFRFVQRYLLLNISHVEGALEC